MSTSPLRDARCACGDEIAPPTAIAPGCVHLEQVALGARADDRSNRVAERSSGGAQHHAAVVRYR